MRGSGNDLTGGAGADTLVGGTGVNIITSNAGNDTMTGGAGADDFIINGTAAQTVKITDFGTGGADRSDSATATVDITISNSTGVTVADDVNKGTTNVTITDGVSAGQTVTFASVDGAAAVRRASTSPQQITTTTSSLLVQPLLTPLLLVR